LEENTNDESEGQWSFEEYYEDADNITSDIRGVQEIELRNYATAEGEEDGMGMGDDSDDSSRDLDSIDNVGDSVHRNVLGLSRDLDSIDNVGDSVHRNVLGLSRDLDSIDTGPDNMIGTTESESDSETESNTDSDGDVDDHTQIHDDTGLIRLHLDSIDNVGDSVHRNTGLIRLHLAESGAQSPPPPLEMAIHVELESGVNMEGNETHASESSSSRSSEPAEFEVAVVAFGVAPVGPAAASGPGVITI